MQFFDNVKNLGKLKSFRTDNIVFMLHYKFTLIVLVVFAILLTTKQLFGDPITCDVESRKEMIDLFCWITGTYILNHSAGSEKNDGKICKGCDKHDAYPNLRHYLGNELAAPKEKTTVGVPNERTTTLMYYQWICLIFCIQALLFYVPRFLWKSWEGGQLSQLLKDLCGPLVSEKWTGLYKQKLVGFLLHSPRRHNIQALRFAFCEVLNLINLLGQICLMDWYLGGEFFSYVPHIFYKGWPEVADQVFPKRTKCNYTRFGVGGSPEKRDALCALPLNVLNEKFFLFLWFWFTLLFVFSILALGYRVPFLCSTNFRTYLLFAQGRDISRKKLRYIVQNLSYGQFFLLYNMGKNLNPLIYTELLSATFEGINGKFDTSLISA